MKVIDIMQKVANEEIFKFRIDDVNYYVDKSNYICEEDGTRVEWYIDDEWLNTNAEVIEEDKKIRKICTFPGLDDDDYAYEDGNRLNNVKINNKMEELLIDKINEIIDYINGGINGE